MLVNKEVAKDGKKGYIVPADAVDPRDDEIGFSFWGQANL